MTTWVTDHVQLEHAASLGVVIAVGGLLYAGSLVVTWVTSGYAALPTIHADILAFTAIVLGIQTVFGAFFLGAIGGK